MYEWSRLLERENVPTLSSSYDNIYTLTEYYNTLRPLVIVFIPSLKSVYQLSNSTQSLKMSSFAWFVIFVQTPMHGKQDYCFDPRGNLLHLMFDTEMLVMCYDDPILREWYSIDGKNTEMFDLIKWHPDRESSEVIQVLTDLSLYERRNDLRGKVLRAVIVKNSILIMVKNNKLEGYLSRTIIELENALNFTVQVVAQALEHGSFNRTTKRWSGAVNLVASGELDMGISDFSMTNVRLDYVDYTVPILTIRSCLYLKQPQVFSVKWFAYFKTFNFALWMSVIITIIIAQIVLAFIRSRIESSSIEQNISDESLRIWGIFCQQGVAGKNLLQEFPRNSSLRLAYFTMLFTAMVISAAYSASLISFVTAHVRDQPFHTVDEFLNDGTYGIIVTRGTSDYDMLVYSKDTLSVKMRKMLRPKHTMPRDLKSGFQSICDDSKLAFYTGYIPDLKKRSTGFSVPCRISRVDFDRMDSLSFILPKKNQYTSVLNYYLQKLLSTGVLNRFKNEENFEEETRFQAVCFSSILSVLIIFVCGSALSLVILILEIYSDRCKDFDDLD
ncbi:PREDICTED: glutamate receptor 2-like [Habropoda laboriosa]|uniref:glutamate receptor 2-like n=1 Tax=Habropoda laboriosa TaxID=597456 RepID=UPI00083D149C|nr:PREDICTED: glutamate receptor 2-like [Habropoda laboriosa]